MTETPSESRPATWHVPECPLLIEYAPPILDEIRLAVVDAFFSLPRGGAEIGGILYGTHGRGEVRILAFRPMECEHAHGPSFVLSDKDRDHLRKQLDEAHLDVALRGLEVVGWYHSHTRSEIFLSDLDLEIYQNFFPEPWQVALVLRPAGMKPTRAGFFFRDSIRMIRSSASYQEFVLAGAHAGGDGKPQAPANGGRVPVALEPELKPAFMPGPEEQPVAAATETAQAPAGEKREPGEAPAGLPDPVPPPRREPLQEARRHPDTAPPAGTPAAEFVPPAFMQPPANERSQVWLWLALVLLLGGVGAGVYFTSGTWLKLFSAKPVYLHLQALDMDGQLRIQWDRAALFSQGVQGGTLEIVDGAGMHSIPLDPAKILMGSFQYARQTQMVEVHLALRTGHGTIEEFTSFIGLPPRPPKPQDSEENRQSPDQAAEAERARGDLKKQELRTLELERSLEQMRQQMRREEERKRVENQMPAAPPPTATAQNPAVNRTPPPPASAIPPAPVNSAPASTAGKQTATVNSQPAEIPQAQPQSVPQEKAQPPAPKPAQTAAAAPPAQPALPSLSGRWVYSRASKSGSPFPPESINLMMTEAYGQVRGIFSGRYRVPRNRKFAPKVTLNFEGAIHPGTSKFTFTSPDGMKGDLEIIRLPGKQDAIEVVWTSPQDKLTFDDIFFRVP